MLISPDISLFYFSYSNQISIELVGYHGCMPDYIKGGFIILSLLNVSHPDDKTFYVYHDLQIHIS
jgi:hypothetical protein